MLRFILFNMLFNSKSPSIGSKTIPFPPRWLVEESIKRKKKKIMKQKTAITEAIKHISEVRDVMTSSSQILGLTQAMDILEEYKILEQEQIRNAYTNKCDFYSCEDKKENCVCGLKYYERTYTQSSE